MKKVVLFFAIVIAAFSANAQINKGQWMVGGNASFASQKFKDIDGSTTYFTLSPNAGYFFINNLAGGLRVNLTSIKEEDEDASTSFTIAPFVRYYFLPAAQKVNIFGDASFGFGSMKNGGDSESMNVWSISAGPAIFLTPNTALEFALNYTSQGGDIYGGDTRLNSFGVNVGFQIHLNGAKK